MNLIDESGRSNSTNKKLFIIGSVGLIALILIVVVLLAVVVSLNGKNNSLYVNNKKYSSSKYLINRDSTLYIGIEDLTQMAGGEYTYKSGDKDVEDSNKCYITNSYESTFFNVDSSKIYKVLEDTEETEYYTLDKPVIKENNKIYMPITAAKVAMNMSFTQVRNTYRLNSIPYIESLYNQAKSAKFVPNSSIVWGTTYANKKLIKNGLVIIKDDSNNLGVAKLSSSTDKNKATTVQVTPVVTVKYKSIKYVEKFNELVVENENGKGIIQLVEENGEFSTKQVVEPGYSEIKQIADDLFIVSNANSTSSASTTSTSTTSTSSSASSNTKKYGLVNHNGDVILPVQYDKIGIDISKYTNNDLDNEYILFDSLIPVESNNVWGFVNLNGKIVIKLAYNSVGYDESNPNSNVVIIPELNALVVKKDGKYGLITKTGGTLVKNVLTRIYKTDENGQEEYSALYNNKKYNVIKDIESLKKIGTENKDTSKNTSTNTTKK